MTIYMTSDLHVDHYIWEGISLEKYISIALKPADVLCVAGDTCDDPNLFVKFYQTVSPLYKKIFVVLGNHDLTIGNKSYFRNNPFAETQNKLDFLKGKISVLGTVSILDGTVEEFEGVKFGGTMACNDWTWAYKLEPDGTDFMLLHNWHYWYDYIHWNYMGNNHAEILKSEMDKLDCVVSQKPDIIMTHFIPLFFGVEREYYNLETTTYFYFNGQKYLDQLKDKCIWQAGHTHAARAKDLHQPDGRLIHLKLNPVGYPDEFPENAGKRDMFIVTR